MNGIGKAGGILTIVASVFGILFGVLMLIFGYLFSDVNIDAVAIAFVIAGIIIIALSCLMISWSRAYMRDGSRQVLLGVLLIICTVLSLGEPLGFILFLLAAIFVLIGKQE